MNSFRRKRWEYSERRGASLIVVMVVLSTAIVMAIAFLHSQSVALTAAGNERKSDLARKAAETGLAAALDAMQRSTWGGVEEIVAAEVGRDNEGTWSYQVTFEPVAGGSSEIEAATAALKVKIRSDGQWQSFDSPRPVKRTTIVTVALVPRLPGRPSREGDTALASDLAVDLTGFEEARDYAVFAADNSDALFVKPQTRIDGSVAVGGRLDVYSGLACDNNRLADLLNGIGIDNGGGPGAPSPHPLAGGVTFDQTPDSTATDALTRLNVPVASAGGFTLPDIDPTFYRSYQVYEGGFEYQAELVGSTLENVSLGPTSSNPLGIFYANGSVTVRNNVHIRGTLVASSNIAFDGGEILISPFDWRDATGATPVIDRNLWPVLPAVVTGGGVSVTSTTRAFVDGSLLALQDLEVRTPNYAEDSVLLNYDGTATVKPLGNGFSEVRIADLLSLLGLTINERHAVRLNGPAGRWYPVVSGNSLTGVFKVRGEIEFASPVACRFRPRRLASFDVAGPTIARRVIFSNPTAWESISSSTWQSYYDNWQSKRAGILGLLLGRPNLTFSQSLAEDGLAFGPTVWLSRASNVTYVCRPPLFQADPSARTAGGGYRWELMSWHEQSP